MPPDDSEEGYSTLPHLCDRRSLGERKPPGQYLSPRTAMNDRNVPPPSEAQYTDTTSATEPPHGLDGISRLSRPPIPQETPPKAGHIVK